MTVIDFGVLFFSWGAIGTALAFGYPFLLQLLPGGWKPSTETPAMQKISFLLVGRRAGALLRAKVRNTLDVLPPDMDAEILIVSDGPDPEMRATAEAFQTPCIQYLETREWVGKNAAISHALPQATGEVVVFSDMDARLANGTLECLLLPFRDPQVGGVCGVRRLDPGPGAPDGQRQYAQWDATIKRLESERGSLTSNDGKCYAVRRQLLRAVPDGVTDDLFLGLEVVRNGYRLCYEPGAVAHIPKPVRTLQHEWSRRRRIVSRGLRSLWYQRELFHPGAHGFYALRLWINKGLRRLLGAHLLLATLGATLLMKGLPPPLPVLLAVSGLAGILVSVLLSGKLRYALVGMFACIPGILDACLGRGTVRWEPKKSDPPPSSCSSNPELKDSKTSSVTF